MSTRMADNATNGNPPEQQPSENNSNEVKSPIVMKIDAPEAEKVAEEEPVAYSFPPSNRGGFSPLKPATGNSFGSGVKFCNTTSTMSHSSPFGLGIPNPLSFSSMRSNPSPFGSGLGMFGGYSNKPHLSTSNSSSSSSPKPLLLRPSQLAVGSSEITNSETTSSEERIVSTSESNEPDSNTQPNSTSDSPKKEATSSQDKNEPSSSQISATTTSSQGGSMKFVPLGATPQQKDDNCTVSGSGVSSSVTGFVFGQNLHARVEAVAVETADSTSGRVASIAGPSQAATSNGTSTSEMLFTSVIKSDPTTADSSGVETPSKSLSEAAAEYEEARANKRKYDEVAVFTGEEDEANVVQVNCKLFAYDNANGQWVERGRGTLRLNDKEGPSGVQSRVVMRTAGSLRVVLNTKIWGGMSVDRPSAKSIRLTAMEGTGQIKVFLVMASPKEIDTLHKSMQVRVLKRQLSEAENGGAGSDIIDPPAAFQNKRRELQADAGGGEEGAEEDKEKTQ